MNLETIKVSAITITTKTILIAILTKNSAERNHRIISQEFFAASCSPAGRAAQSDWGNSKKNDSNITRSI